MPWIYLDLPITISLDSPLHIGSGYGWGLIRKAIVKFPEAGEERPEYHPYIPGSALKGRVRNICEDLARQAGLPVCGLPRVGEAPEGSGHSSGRCIICRIFGAIGGNSPDGRGLRWENAYQAPTQRDLSPQIMERTQVQISRTRGMAAEERLFTTELAPPDLTFDGRVVGWLEGTECSISPGYYEVGLLLAGLRLVDSLGGMRRRGPGRCTVTLPEVISLKAEGSEEPVRSPFTDLLATVEALGLFDAEGEQRSGA